MSSRSHEGPLPLELVEQVIACAGLLVLGDSPKLALRLQLVSRTSRRLLLPIIYFVLVVNLPTSETDDEHLHPPSFLFFRHLLEFDTCAPRAHVRHIIFKGTRLPFSKHTGSLPQYKATQTWPLDTIAMPNFQGIAKFVEHCRIEPTAIVLRNPQSDFCWSVGFYLSVRRIRQAGQVVSIGPISSTRLQEQHFYVRRQRNLRDVRMYGKDAEACTLHILLDWAPEKVLVLEQQFLAVERVLDDVLQFTNISVVLELRRDDAYQQELSLEFVQYVQGLREVKWRGIASEQLEQTWRVANLPESLDEYATDVRGTGEPPAAGPII